MAIEGLSELDARWRRAQEVRHNARGGFLSLRPALYACGSGRAVFRSFRHAEGFS
jgi:hypothetical protein